MMNECSKCKERKCRMCCDNSPNGGLPCTDRTPLLQEEKLNEIKRIRTFDVTQVEYLLRRIIISEHLSPKMFQFIRKTIDEICSIDVNSGQQHSRETHKAICIDQKNIGKEQDSNDEIVGIVIRKSVVESPKFIRVRGKSNALKRCGSTLNNRERKRQAYDRRKRNRKKKFGEW